MKSVNFEWNLWRFVGYLQLENLNLNPLRLRIESVKNLEDSDFLKAIFIATRWLFPNKLCQIYNYDGNYGNGDQGAFMWVSKERSQRYFRRSQRVFGDQDISGTFQEVLRDFHSVPGILRGPWGCPQEITEAF